ncbi:MAG: 3-isopropylmalate dehydratase small subunit [Acidimicrobiia bacterium]|nr:3-isopropylmalate dehydratase small subunit [Acidimicrobiia bacterium]
MIPSDWLKRVERTGFGAGLFSEWRDDPDFIMNNPAYASASVLLAGPNFGVGSSREHAVWALQDYGFGAIVSPRFGDIFRNNALKGGLLPIVIEEQLIESIAQAVTADPTTIIEIDVADRTLKVPAIDVSVTFPLDDFTQWRLLEGLDDIGITLRNEADITAFETKRPSYKPSVSAD